MAVFLCCFFLLKNCVGCFCAVIFFIKLFWLTHWQPGWLTGPRFTMTIDTDRIMPIPLWRCFFGDFQKGIESYLFIPPTPAKHNALRVLFFSNGNFQKGGEFEKERDPLSLRKCSVEKSGEGTGPRNQFLSKFLIPAQ